MKAVVLAAAGVAALMMPSLLAAQAKEEGSMKTIVQIAKEDGKFSTLVTALQAAGLVEALSGKGPFTVFAPTDEAFAKLPSGTVEALLKDKEQLKSILTYHVLPAKVMSGDVVRNGGAKPTTLNGSPLYIEVSNGTVLVNGAKVVAADITGSNGVIHVIDAVVLPKPAGAGSR